MNEKFERVCVCKKKNEREEEKNKKNGVIKRNIKVG